ncbi:trafficking protein particle complex subunit 11 [Leptopilina boulardi]|uniref:trafficking protein particle complex subunit 11 n=1 Tax=Leptopilina boulardi TaxID=63433 RepID=UPI0021F5A955|nr:trafficking protein particle complex subunit 11 [Leptopilina boulardi]XP_051176752.1 trafficking protein particle complex subunit 11 [Leptopilina boulardi]
MFELPAELTAKPLAFVAITGLNMSNTIHKSIWDAFINNRRPDSAAIQYKLLSGSFEFPTVKPKRNSYEWYIPKGILKRNWMNKYLNEIPSLVVVFYDLDWTDPMWNEKKMECVSRVDSLRAVSEGRNPRIAIVLIQRHAAPPGTEDVLATERATALYTACDIPAKSLYILPLGDHLMGYITRLEGAFNDLAQGFYHLEYRNVKGHRDQLNKTTHQYLFIRHQFKMGFFNELKHEQHTAQKHYQQAYNNLLDIRMTDTNSLEIKTVASFLNYKLCKLMFLLNLPKDAISQFKSHTERFKIRPGPSELIFEHHAWMSSQYSTFAELFDEAIRQGLPAVQTQHPGYYFQLAAKYASERQLASKEICSSVKSYPEPDPLGDEEKMEFYGQRPWRLGKLNAEPADSMGETAAIQALQFREKTTVNHSMIIIGLLGNAISQFKIYRCPRMRRVLVVQMAEEYFNAKDYGKVLTLLIHMLWEYRSERWPLLLTNILKTALRAAYLSVNVQDYLALALESLGPTTLFSNEHHSTIHANIFSILQRKPPNPEPDLPEHDKSVVQKWNSELSRPEPILFTIDDNTTLSFIEIKTRFTEPKYTVNSNVTIQVLVRNLCRENIEFSKISVTVSNPGYNLEIPIIGSSEDFKFRQNEIKKFTCQFQVQCNGNEIQISAVSFYLGRENNCCVVMRFSPNGSDNSVDRLYPEIQQLRSSEFDRMRPLTTAQIKHEESKIILKAESEEPALLGEWFPIKISIFTAENITKSILKMSLVNTGNNEQLTELSLNAKDKQSHIADEVNIVENISIERIIYFRAHKIGIRSFMIKLDYLKNDQKKSTEPLMLDVSVVKPFEITTQFYTMLYEPLTKGFINEPFFMMPHITCTSPWPIKIIGTSIELGDSIQRESEGKMEDKEEKNEECILAETILKEGEAGTDVYSVFPKIGSEQPTSTGVYTVRWKRANNENSLETSNSVTLTPLWVENSVIGIEAKLPAFGSVRTPLCITYYIRNHSDFLITLHMTMEASDAFMFAGNKEVDIYILPESERKVEWILRPLVAGFVALPTLTLAVSEEEEHKLSKNKLAEVLERSLPSHIYIMPKSQISEE